MMSGTVLAEPMLPQLALALRVTVSPSSPPMTGANRNSTVVPALDRVVVVTSTVFAAGKATEASDSPSSALALA